jgi:hypothetical protein
MRITETRSAGWSVKRSRRWTGGRIFHADHHPLVHGSKTGFTENTSIAIAIAVVVFLEDLSSHWLSIEIRAIRV